MLHEHLSFQNNGWRQAAGWDTAEAWVGSLPVGKGVSRVDMVCLRCKSINFGAERARVHQKGEPIEAELELDHLRRNAERAGPLGAPLTRFAAIECLKELNTTSP